MITLNTDDVDLLVVALRHSADTVEKHLDQKKIVPAPKRLADYLVALAKLLAKLRPDD